MIPFETSSIQVSPEWERINLEGVTGVQLVIGAPDAGKSTFARYLYYRHAMSGQSTAYIDGDPGQSFLGPPTTQTLVLVKPGDPSFPTRGTVWRKFVGSTSPSGHLLPTVVGAGRLCERARQAGTEVVVYDTSGLVEPRQGGLALKVAKIDLLQPRRVYAIQREKEMGPLLSMLHKKGGSEVILLAPSGAVMPRSMERRQTYRTQQFANYFREAEKQTLKWMKYGIYPAPRFALGRLIALEDQEGFTLALGIVVGIDREKREVTVLAPDLDLGQVKMLNIGDMLVDPVTFQDIRLE